MECERQLIFFIHKPLCWGLQLKSDYVTPDYRKLREPRDWDKCLIDSGTTLSTLPREMNSYNFSLKFIESYM